MPTWRVVTSTFSNEYWERTNPVLIRGERGIAEFYDAAGKVIRIREKIGDGVETSPGVITGTRWKDLPWYSQDGEKGDKGDMPKHEWSGTALRFQNPDGSWGNRVDLKGEPGNVANAIPATSTNLGGVMPATGLRTTVEGYEYVILAWDKQGCYPDPILVVHNNSAWVWLAKNGIGEAAGVREPGLSTSAAYWKKLAFFEDIIFDPWTIFPIRVPIPVQGVKFNTNDRHPIMPGETVPRQNWVICDGGSDFAGGVTPNLSGRFIIGTSNTILAGNTAGSQTHSHSCSGSVGPTTLSTSQMPSHNHSVPIPISWSSNSPYPRDGGRYSVSSNASSSSSSYAGGYSSHTHSMTSVSINSQSNMPPYYALTYVMRIF